MKNYTVKLDVQVTRRKRFHHIFDEAGTYRATQQRSGAVLDWLYDNGQTQVVIVTSARTYLCEFKVIEHAPETEGD